LVNFVISFLYQSQKIHRYINRITKLSIMLNKIYSKIDFLTSYTLTMASKRKRRKW
jgi:hypothetical protein